MREVPRNVKDLLVRVSVPDVEGVNSPPGGLMKARTLSEGEKVGTEVLPGRVWVENIEGVAWTPPVGDVFPPR